MRNKASNKILSFALAAAMLLGVFTAAPSMTVQAADIEMGAGDSLANPDSTVSGSYSKYQTVYFGEYNGSPIPWRVLENAGGEALLLSENSLTSMAYKLGTNVWKDSTIREYLNDDLFNGLTSGLQDAIADTYTTVGANTTIDKLYLLSAAEASALSSGDLSFSGLWWLRSPGTYVYTAAVVSNSGVVNYTGINVNNSLAVRPAFRIPEDSNIFTSGSGSDGDPWIVGGTEQKTLAVDNYVQFEINSSPYKWKVIKIDNGYATLLCTSTLGSRPFDANMNNVWATSDIRAFLNPATEWAYDANTFSFGGGEKAAIVKAATTVDGQQQTTDRLFLLSTEQARNVDYFPKGNTDRRLSDNWWLRSPGDNDDYAAFVYDYGYVVTITGLVSNDYAIRPAFKLNLSSVIFTSAASGASVKSAAVGGTSLSAAEPPTDAVKLTVKDNDNLSLTCTDIATRTVRVGDTVNIDYSDAVTENLGSGLGKYVSCVIVNDSTGEITHYGKLSDEDEGTASFTVPTLADDNYTIKLFNEECNGDNYTDYASTPVEIDMEVVNISTSDANVTIDPDTITFANETFGYNQPAAQAITITNNGGVDAAITSVTLSGNNPTDFEIIGGGSTVTKNGNISTWTVRPKAGLSVGIHTADITVAYENGSSSPATAAVSFEVTAGSSTPALNVSPTNHDFGNVPVSTTTSALTVSASGSDLTDDITYALGGTDPSAFSVTETSWNATTGGTLSMTFTPTAEQAYNATLTISSQGAADVTVALSGTGEAIPPSGVPAVTSSNPIELDLNGTTTAYIHISLGQSGDVLANRAEIAVTSGSAVRVDPDTLTADGNVEVEAISEGTAEITVTFHDGDVTDDTYDRVINVNVTDNQTPQPPVTNHTITASAGSGGNISPSGSIAVDDGDDQTFTIAADTGYAISAVTVDGSDVGAVDSYTFDNVTDNHSIHAEFSQEITPTPTPSRDSSDSGSSGSGSSTQDTVRTTIPSTLVVDASKAKAALAEREKSGANKARIRHNGEIKVLAEAWPLFGNVPVDFDTLDDGAVQVRVTVREPGKMTGEKLLSGYVKGSIVDSRKTLFEKWFKNKVRVIHFDRQGNFGQSVEIAAKLDLTGIDTSNLCIYAYNKASNTYRRIEKPTYWIDKNGYLHFTTELAGDIIVSEGPLKKK